MHPSVRQNEFATEVNIQKIFFFLIMSPPVMKDEDVSMFKIIQEKVGIKAFRYISRSHVTIDL